MTIIHVGQLLSDLKCRFLNFLRPTVTLTATTIKDRFSFSNGYPLAD